MTEEMIQMLINAARDETPLDDPNEEFDLLDACGGNYCDAYSIGYDVAYTLLARQVLDSLGISWK